MVKSMTEAHKRSNRHPKYKTAYRVKNWAEYDKALRDRGDITLWISQDGFKWVLLGPRDTVGLVRPLSSHA